MAYSQSVRQCSAVRLSKVELFPSALHGYKLLRLEPKIISALTHFLETSLKNRPVEWEPQYNLTPVTFGDSQLVQNATQAENTKTKAKNAIPGPERKAEDSRQQKADPIQSKKNLPTPAPETKLSDKND